MKIRKTQYVVVIRGKSRWDVQVFGPYSRTKAEDVANEKIKVHPLLTVGVFPIVR